MEAQLLLAIDSSEHSIHAVKKAIELHEQLKEAKLHILHVFAKSPSLSEMEHYSFDISELLHQRAVQALRPLLSILEQSHIPYHLEVAIGNPAEEILSYANAIKPLMVIVGSRGLSTISEVFLGSVSHKLVHDSNIPILVVK
ncbi:universal stress protein [Bacillus kexueae]|uniref:universal stress protein n=1 Tax=Aeribacillus kexueae TaxID=2078952 RepID=UPI001FAF37B2|nr:universal stress protein [Bacillus kexueae]